MPKKTKTSSYGLSKREGHDSSEFYNRSMYQSLNTNNGIQLTEGEAIPLSE